MKIAVFHELHQGGAYRALTEISASLKSSNTVDLYYLDNNYNKSDEEHFNNIYFFKLGEVEWKGGNWRLKLYKDTLELYRLYILHKKIAGIIDSRKYSAVFVHPSKFTQAPFILRFLKTKKIYYCQEPLRIAYEDISERRRNINLLKFYYEKLNLFVRKYIDKANIIHSDLILANSNNSKSNIKTAYGLNSIVCYLGVDTKIFKPTVAKKDIDILFVGSYDYCDGFELFKKANKYLKIQIRAKIHNWREKWISDNELAMLYNRSRIVIALARNEPFGLIPLEAMACGVPVVAVDEGGYRESVVNGKTGLLIPRNPKILAQKLDYLLSHNEILKRMGSRARVHVLKNWTWEKSAQKMLKVIKSAVTRSI